MRNTQTLMLLLFVGCIDGEDARLTVDTLRLEAVELFAWPSNAELTSIIPHPLDDQKFFASTRTSLLTINNRGRCRMTLGIDHNLLDKCELQSMATEVDFSNIVQLYYAEDLSPHYELILIIDFADSVIWKYDIVSREYGIVESDFNEGYNYWSSYTATPGYITKECENYEKGLYRVYAQIDFGEVSTWNMRIIDNPRTEELRNSQNSTHSMFTKTDISCEKTAAVSLPTDEQVSKLNRYVWLDNLIVYRDDNRKLKRLDNKPIEVVDSTSNEMVGEFYLVNELSERKLLAATGNKVLVLEDKRNDVEDHAIHPKTRQFHYRFAMHERGYRCSRRDSVISEHMHVMSLETCVYLCTSNQPDCNGVTYDDVELLCRLQSAVTVYTSKIFPNSFCIEKKDLI